MTEHPLTDEICDMIQDSTHPCDPANMRAAADWQLQEVLKFMKKHEQLFGGSGMIFILEDAMRPNTTQEDN